MEAVGPQVQTFRPGDEVFGWCAGAFAEYASASEDQLVSKPPNLTFEQAAAVGVSATTALQLLRDDGNIQSGQKVLINGASSSVGTFAVQIAKAFGADVTGVCSAANVEIVRAIGADHVIDYSGADFRQGAERYDLILDNVGDHSMADTRRALTPTGMLISNGGGHSGGKLGRVIRGAVASMFVRQQARPSVKSQNRDDLIALKALVEAGKVTPVIGGTYPLSRPLRRLPMSQLGTCEGRWSSPCLGNRMMRPLRTTRRMRRGLQTWRCRHDRARRSGSVRGSTEDRLSRTSRSAQHGLSFDLDRPDRDRSWFADRKRQPDHGHRQRPAGGRNRWRLLAGLAGATALMIIVRLRYPRWWFDFARELTRFGARVSAYLALLTDRYPSTVDEQSVHLEIEYPDVERDLNRWLPLVKWLLAIPHYFVLLFLWIGALIAIVIAWFAILITGRYPKPLFDYVVGVSRWTLRVTAYAFLLVTDRYPPFSLSEGA